MNYDLYTKIDFYQNDIRIFYQFFKRFEIFWWYEMEG